MNEVLGARRVAGAEHSTETDHSQFAILRRCALAAITVYSRVAHIYTIYMAYLF